MQIRFKQSVASDTCAFRAGHILSLPKLPRGWDAWLRGGVIELLPDADERAELPALEETAVRPVGRRRRARGSTSVA
jgi:hypothetical protein